MHVHPMCSHAGAVGGYKQEVVAEGGVKSAGWQRQTVCWAVQVVQAVHQMMVLRLAAAAAAAAVVVGKCTRRTGSGNAPFVTDKDDTMVPAATAPDHVHVPTPQ